MGTNASNYLEDGETFAIPANESELFDATNFLIEALTALDNHTHATGRGAAVTRVSAATLLGIRSTAAAFDMVIANSENLSGSKTLTITLGDANRTLQFGGNISTASSFGTSGAFSLTLTATGPTNVTLPTTGTLATLAGSEPLTNKTLTNPTINGFTGDTTVVNIGSGQLYKDASGNLGLGTTSPAQKLHVKGSAAPAAAGVISIHDGTGNAPSSGSAAATLLFQARDTDIRTVSKIEAVHTTINGTGGDLYFHTMLSDTLTKRMIISANGDVGTTVFIGGDPLGAFNATGGTQALTVYGTSASTNAAANIVGIAISNKSSTANNSSGLHFAFQDSDGSPSYISSSIVGVHGTRVQNQYSAGQLLFLTSTSTNSAPSEKWRITSEGVWTSTGDATDPGTVPSNVTVDGSIIATGGIAMADALASWIDDVAHGGATSTIYIGNQFINTTSDYRVKKNIREWDESALGLIDRVNVVTFEWANDESLEIQNKRGPWVGTIAQELVRVAPWVINAPEDAANCEDCLAGRPCFRKGHEGRWHVQYEHLVPMLISGIQELVDHIRDADSFGALQQRLAL